MTISPELERDSLVRTPSKTGFSVKSAYRKQCPMRDFLQMQGYRKSFGILYRMQRYITDANIYYGELHPMSSQQEQESAKSSKLEESNCCICDHELETYEHLFLRCPPMIMIWWNSRWQLKLEAFKDWTMLQWLEKLLKDDNSFPMPVMEKKQVLNFVIICMEKAESEETWRKSANLGGDQPLFSLSKPWEGRNNSIDHMDIYNGLLQHFTVLLYTNENYVPLNTSWSTTHYLQHFTILLYTNENHAPLNTLWSSTESIKILLDDITHNLSIITSNHLLLITSAPQRQAYGHMCCGVHCKEHWQV
ncbi:hypothetical protein M9H77_33820 [Catharanthus roseus]|uniref:Uncharacterized protein n=1 Tax=Catharanthus roseus TaxID=4058 RepID=A0ACB9ZN03_CATRO|nr:hypothetical protein M9H77_33820 [Catharanthus roseus]